MRIPTDARAGRSTALIGLLIAVGWVSATGGRVSEALLLLLAFALASLAAKPRAFVLALLVSLMLSKIRLRIGPITLLPEHVVLAGTLFVLVSRASRSVFRRPKPGEALLALWVLWNFLASAFLAPSRNQSLKITLWIACAWMIGWCISGALQAEIIQRDRLLRAAGALCAAVSIYAIATWVLSARGFSHVGTVTDFGSRLPRSMGFTSEPNLLAAQCIIGLALFLILAVEHGAAPRWAVLALVGGITVSFTRAAWLALVPLGAGYVILVRSKQPMSPIARARLRTNGKKVAGLVFTLLLGFVIIRASAFGGTSRIKSVLSLHSGTGLYRTQTWGTAIGDLRHDPVAMVTGFGTNTFEQRHASLNTSNGRLYLSGLPIIVLYDTGLIGVLLFFGGLLLSVLPARRRLRAAESVGVSALLICATATNPIWFGFVWVFLGVLQAPAPDRGSLEAGPANAHRQPAGLATSAE
jgi:hypothetical protein